ncbi:Replication-associated recombination protein A [invertebrate metagenome]|uniref:Replication-associated recombination protein A n=1 Tax=invertebrate metagenome TaxID=1711999 RepID=A0A2H9TBC4_9ZZZZ
MGSKMLDDTSDSELFNMEMDPLDFQPLAARMRPRNLDSFFGQQHLLSPERPLRKALDNGVVHSMVLWGPPGVGKTTLAKLMASCCHCHFESLSAVLSGVKDIRLAIDNARQYRQAYRKKTILFVDEVHRFNKSQQDVFLPYIEEGTIVFIGATTENPSFSLNSALLSRLRVYVLKPLEEAALGQLLNRALHDEVYGLGKQHFSIQKEAAELLVQGSDGDARSLLNMLSVAAEIAESIITEEVVKSVLANASRRMDRRGDVFYDQLSAFHKSVRGSSPDGALYWAARMVDGGVDPLVLVRRLVAIASEDIGNADPRALEITINAWQAYERLGSPEGLLSLAQATVYCACAPKSNAVYKAWKAALSDVKQGQSYPVPEHLCNAPTELLKTLGKGKTYRYVHDEPDAYAAGECYFPEQMATVTYYEPNERGLEIKIREKLTRLREKDVLSSVKLY